MLLGNPDWRARAVLNRPSTDAYLEEREDVRILVIEPHFSGHRGAYVERIVQSGRMRGHDIHLATLKSSLQHAKAGDIRKRLESDAHLWVLPSSETSSIFGVRTAFLAQVSMLRDFANWYKVIATQLGVDLVFVPYGDYCLHAAGLLGSPFGDTPWALLTMRSTFHLRALGIRGDSLRWTDSLKQRIFLRLLATPNLRALLTIDETLPSYLREVKPNLCAKVTYVPDPAAMISEVSPSEARARYGICEDRFVVLVYGALTKRKAVDILLKGLANPTVPERVSALLVGEQDEWTRDFLASDFATTLKKKNRIFEFHRFADAHDEAMAFAASDVVWLGYRKHDAMSGVLVQAGQSRKPVIACDNGLIGWLTTTYGLGSTVTLGAVEELSRVLRDMESLGDYAAECGARGGSKFLAHTPEAFGNSIWAACERASN